MINAIEMLNKASNGKYAVPHFNINNLEWAKYVLEECEELRSPVIIGVSEGAVKYMGGYNVVSGMVRGLLKDLNTTIPVVLHLDHGSSVESCKKAIDAGFTSVMIDASKHELDDNINITKEVVEYARRFNVSVEAEIGHVGTGENATLSEEFYARVDDSIKFYNETGIDFLAPAVGSAHGLYPGSLKRNLSFDRIKEIKEAIKIPLVLHGGTGVPEDEIRKCILSGISKININTELQISWSKAVREYLDNDKCVYDPRKIIGSGESAIKQSVRNKVTLLGSNNRI